SAAFPERKAQKFRLADGNAGLMLFQAIHLGLMDGSQAQIDLFKLIPRKASFNQRDQLADLRGVGVAGSDGHTAKALLQPCTKCELEGAGNQWVVEEVVRPWIKHAV